MKCIDSNFQFRLIFYFINKTEINLIDKFGVQSLRSQCNKKSSSTSCIPKAKGQRERMLGETVSNNGILVHDIAIVGPYEGDNFTTIGEAIASAPDHLNPEDGYFVIYGRQGDYQEYIIVPKDKKNLMLIGDGINKTVITGNHNRIDGWTTYNSSTFGMYIKFSFHFSLL